MTPAQVAADASRVASLTSLCGLQEIQPDEDTDVVVEALGTGWGMVGWELEVPIVYKHARWRLRSRQVIKFRRPPGLPGHHSVNGGIVAAVFGRTARPHLPSFAVVNTHLINAGEDQATQARWTTEWTTYLDVVRSYARHGLTVFTTGDLNVIRPPEVPGHWRWLNDKARNLDHIGTMTTAARPRWQMAEHVTQDKYDLNSDHKLHVITGPLRYVP